MLDVFYSPNDLLMALLFASTLALGACLWLVWMEMRRLSRRERKMLRETESYVHQQLAALNEKLSGEMIRQRRDTENMERSLEAAMRRRLDELQGLIESLRILEARLQARIATPPEDESSATVAKEARAGFSVIARPPKPGSRESSG
ncbi:MAG TPA: hypothetical protein VJW51_01755 [Candidatus Acidoferrales bacterium]|nr:hypothetical protein [Candidatus Acidoferrales bacterium]